MKKEHDIFSGLGESTCTCNELKELESACKSVDLDLHDGKQEFLSKDENDDTNAPPVQNLKTKMNDENEPIHEATNGIKIIPLKGNLKTIASKKKYKHLFDHVHLSQQSAHLLREDYLRTILKSDSGRGSSVSIDGSSNVSSISVETAKYLFAINEHLRDEIKNKILDMGRENSFSTSQHDGTSPNTIFFEMI